MSASPPIAARAVRRFAAPAERVFGAWLDPATAGRWLFSTPAGEMVRVEIDARVGGRFRFVDRRDGVDVDHTGEYLEIDPPRRLVFTFAANGEGGDRVTVEITPLDGGCELVLTHEMQPQWAEYRDRASEGWRGILEGLAATLGESSGATQPG